jgi:capsule polysaccharide export protein KpsE/RkpR
MENNIFNNIDLFRMMNRWKLHLMIITAVAALLAVFFSGPMFIKPKFKSFTVLYPSNLIPYGAETPTEQMLQLFQSNEIEQTITKKYNLYRHYDIDTNAASHQYYLNTEFGENVKISKTEYEAVKVEIYDTDPQTAHDIALEFIKLFNIKTRELHKKKSEEVVLIHKNELDRKQRELDSIGTLLKEMKVKYGLLDYKSQSKEASKEYYKSLGGNAQKTSDIVASIRNLEEKGHEFIQLEEHLNGAIATYQRVKIAYDEALRDVEKKLTYTNVIIAPEVPDKKSSPVRWMIVVFTTISSFVLALFVISVLDRFRK